MSTILISFATITAQENFNPHRVLGVYSYYNLYDDYLVTDIPTELLTHVVYEHVDISASNQCISRDPWADFEFSYPGDQQFQRVRGNFNQLQEMRERNPDLRIIMSIGGWEMSGNFSEIVANDQTRIRFVRSCINFMREYGFDGIMVDWRYPVNGGQTLGAPDDINNYPLLLADFRGQLDYWQEQDSANYTLAITAPAIPDLLQNFAMDEMVIYLDFISMRAFSFEGSWSELAAHQAPLYVSHADPRDTESQSAYTVSGAVESLLNMGVPAGKIVLGIGFSGQSWQGVRSNDLFGLYERPIGVPNNTRGDGQLYYRDLTNFFNSDNYIRYFDDSAGVPWLYNETAGIAISYEDVESVREKAAYVRRLDLGGVSVWELSYDDDNHSLLETLYNFLNGS